MESNTKMMKMDDGSAVATSETPDETSAGSDLWGATDPTIPVTDASADPTYPAPTPETCVWDTYSATGSHPKHANSRKNKNYQVPKTFGLANGITVILTLEGGKMVMYVGYLQAHLYPGKHPTSEAKSLMLRIEGEKAILKLLNTNNNGAFPRTYTSYRHMVPEIIDICDEETGKPVVKLGTGKNNTNMMMEVRMCLANDLKKTLILPAESVEKFSRALPYMRSHAQFLASNKACYRLMLDEINQHCKARMVHDKTLDLARCVSAITTFDLKKEIVESFEADCNRFDTKCNVNTYSLFSLCIGQIESLRSRWNETIPSNLNPMLLI
jgi:hypothetical protein